MKIDWLTFFAQQEFVDLGLAELSEFEQEEIQLASVPNSSSNTVDTPGSTKSSVNLNNDENDPNNQNMKKNICTTCSNKKNSNGHQERTGGIKCGALSYAALQMIEEDLFIPWKNL